MGKISPTLYLITVFNLNFCSAIIVSMIFPIQSLCVIDFGMAKDRTEAGYYAGAVSAMYLLGMAISSPIWGWFMDNYGRRNGLIVSLASLVFLCLL